MAKEEIGKLLDDSKGRLDADCEGFEKSVRDELASYKAKTMDRI